MNIHFLMRLVKGILPIGTLAALFFAVACSKEAPDVNPGPTGEVTRAEVNRWVVDSMRYWYYWNTTIPGDQQLNFNEDPKVFFESLLNRPADRFSWIQNIRELEDELAGIIKTSGLGYGFFGINKGNEIIAGLTVRYVFEGSPADMAGIERGDLFIELNGREMTVDDDGYVENIEPLLSGDPFSLTKAELDEDGSIVNTGETVDLIPVVGFQEPAIHLDTVLITENGTKVGYLFYNRFLIDQAQELVDAFAKFKEANVQELIIDERYNGGGSVTIAGLLSALIHRDFDINSPFIQMDYNSNIKDEEYTYADLFGMENNDLVQALNLGLGRVFILATSSSASASELLINNLRPFMGNANVIHIGSTTVGKDEASITIQNTDPRFKDSWGIQPIILKYQNRNGEGGFVNGLTPQYAATEQSVALQPMGSKDDPLIGTALGIIDPGMRARLALQMRAGQAKLNSGIMELPAGGKDVSESRPLDVTDLWKGKTLPLR